MPDKVEAHRFSQEQWVTMRDTGEHVKVESWSAIAGAYRVHSSKRGLLFAGEGDLAELCVHPQAHLGKHWGRCQAPRCGAPLTPELSICPTCQMPKCTCGRCRCVPKPARRSGFRP
jgi:hypothetical protein